MSSEGMCRVYTLPLTTALRWNYDAVTFCCSAKTAKWTRGYAATRWLERMPLTRRRRALLVFAFCMLYVL